MKVKKLLKAVRKHGTIPVDLPKGFRLDKEGELILPKDAGECADLLYRTREVRLALERQAERLKKGETKLQEYFIESLPKSSTGIAGLEARVQITMKAVPQVENWDQFYEYVRRNKAFELLQRRLNEGAVKERWDANVEVPGVTTFNAKKVSCTKL